MCLYNCSETQPLEDLEKILPEYFLNSMAASREHRGTEGLEHFHSHKRNDMELLPAQMDPALWCCPTD